MGKKKSDDLKKYPDWFGDMRSIFDEIQEHHWEQMNKWGLQKRTLFEWQNYLTEEVGELARAIAENQYRKGTYKQIKEEAIQVASLACKIIAIIPNKELP